MHINMGQTGERSGIIQKQSVVVGQLKKESEMLNANGDTINPRTKQIIKRKEEEKA